MTTAQHNIAQDILTQMGGAGRLKAMIGAYAFSSRGDDNETLSFKFKAGRKANYCEITLNGLDLYNMKISKTSTNRKTYEIKEKIVLEESNLYNDMIKKQFERATGLYLTL